MVLLLGFSLAGEVDAAVVELNNVPISEKAELIDGTTYIPLRHLLESSGEWDISWDAATRTALAKGEHFTLSFPTGRSCILLDGAAYEAETSYLKDGMTYVPLRSTAQLCALAVEWHGADRPILLSSHQTGYSEDDLYWLSRIISAESRGESLLGQLAVGTVVLNRLRSEDFPNTIHDVIFDTKNGTQFEPVANGTVYDPPAVSSLLAAKLCLDGTRVAGESLYFYAPALSQGLWMNANRPYLTTIGCHRFFL